MDKADKYLLHCSGVYMMLAWMEKQAEIGTGTSFWQQQQTIVLSALGSQYFALGASNKKRAKLPFLAIQPNESQWMQLISWDYAAIREKDKHLYLISSIVKGDDVEYPDIPAFAIAITFDDFTKLDLLNGYDKLESREFFVDTDNTVRVNYHKKLLTLPLKHLKFFENFLETSKVTNYTDLLTNKERQLQAEFFNGAPEYKGDIINSHASQEIQKLYDKVTKKEL